MSETMRITTGEATTKRHPAFATKPKYSIINDPVPHALSQAEHELLVRNLMHSRGASVQLTRKLLRLYQERTVACQQMMRERGELPTADPELG